VSIPPASIIERDSSESTHLYYEDPDSPLAFEWIANAAYPEIRVFGEEGLTRRKEVCRIVLGTGFHSSVIHAFLLGRLYGYWEGRRTAADPAPEGMGEELCEPWEPVGP
jgi:hypothetical protein